MSDEGVEIVLYQDNALERRVMKSLTVQSIVDAKSLTSLNREALLACYGNGNIKERRANGESNAVAAELRQIINRAIFESGFGGTWEDREIKIFILTAIQDVFRDFKGLTVQEVQIAFRKGVREEYGELHGLSIRAVHKWLRAYVAQTKKKAMSQLKLLDKPKEIKPTNEEIEQKHQQHLERIYSWYDSFKESGEYNFQDYGNVLYDKLDNLGLIKFTPTQKQKIYKAAKEVVMAQYRADKAKNTIQRNEFSKLLKKVVDDHPDARIRIRIEAKHLALQKFITECVKKKKSLRELIEFTQASAKQN